MLLQVEQQHSIPWILVSPAQSFVYGLKDQAVSLWMEQSVDKDTAQALCQQLTQVLLLYVGDAENKNAWVLAGSWR